MVKAPKTKTIDGIQFKLSRVSFSHLGQGKKWVTDGAKNARRAGKRARIIDQPFDGHRKYILYVH